MWKRIKLYHNHSHRGHSHGMIDLSIITRDKGIRAVQWSFIGLFLTATLQLVVAVLSGSVALLADTIHNFGDAGTAIPLWIAFRLGKRKPSKRFTYGLGKVEDVVGVVIVLIIFASATFAAYQSVYRIFHPIQVNYLAVVAMAAIIGFLGNELVAVFRIRIGKEINSAALVADGYHARTDGIASLAVLVGALGVHLGFPLADPLIGLIITIIILRVVWQSARAVFLRLLDGIDREVLHEIEHAVEHTKGVEEVSDIRVRWLGHQLQTELNIAVNSQLSVEQGHEIAKEVRHNLLHHLPHLANVVLQQFNYAI